MSFSIKQLLGFVLVVGLGMVALANADKAFVGSIARLTVMCMLILAAYGIWTSNRETRAFRIGFLCWGGLYFLFHVAIDVETLNLGTSYFLGYLLNVLEPGAIVRDAQGTITGVHGTLMDRFYLIGQCQLSILVGLIGGWVTVYFYRKRQRMLGD